MFEFPPPPRKRMLRMPTASYWVFGAIGFFLLLWSMNGMTSH